MGKWSLTYFIIQREGEDSPKKHLENPQTLLQEQTFSVETQENPPPATKNSSRSSSCKSVPSGSPSEQLQLSLTCQHS